MWTRCFCRNVTDCVVVASCVIWRYNRIKANCWRSFFSVPGRCWWCKLSVFLGNLRDKRLVQNNKRSRSLTGDSSNDKLPTRTAAELKLCQTKRRLCVVDRKASNTTFSSFTFSQTFPRRRRGRRACITEQEHSCISKWSGLCATTRNSTINNNTNIDGSFLEISDPKTRFRSGFKICCLFWNRTIILTKKHKDEESGRILRWIKYRLLNTETERYARSKSKSGGILWRYKLLKYKNFTWQGSLPFQNGRIKHIGAYRSSFHRFFLCNF